jgi:hypothetical protein
MSNKKNKEYAIERIPSQYELMKARENFIDFTNKYLKKEVDAAQKSVAPHPVELYLNSNNDELPTLTIHPIKVYPPSPVLYLMKKYEEEIIRSVMQQSTFLFKDSSDSPAGCSEAPQS